MAKLDVVGCLPSKVLGLQRDMLEKWSGPDGDLWVERIALTLQGKNPLEAVALGPKWADEICVQARRKLKKFSDGMCKLIRFHHLGRRSFWKTPPSIICGRFSCLKRTSRNHSSTGDTLRWKHGITTTSSPAISKARPPLSF